MTLCEVLCWTSEIEVVYEHTYLLWLPLETPAKSLISGSINAFSADPPRVTVAGTINAVKPQRILTITTRLPLA